MIFWACVVTGMVSASFGFIVGALMGNARYSELMDEYERLTDRDDRGRFVGDDET